VLGKLVLSSDGSFHPSEYFGWSALLTGPDAKDTVLTDGRTTVHVESAIALRSGSSGASGDGSCD